MSGSDQSGDGDRAVLAQARSQIRRRREDLSALANGTKEVNEDARKAIAALIKLALAATGGNLVKAARFHQQSA